MNPSFVIATTFDAGNDLLQTVLTTGLARRVVTAREDLAALQNETILLLAWPYLLKSEFLKRQVKVFNVHNALLPKYRGRHAFTWAMIHGEREVGYSLHEVDEGIDSGPVYAQMRLTIYDEDDINSVFTRSWENLKVWLPEQLKLLCSGLLVATPQDERAASLFRARKPEDGLIRWNQTGRQIRNFIRALRPPYTPAVFMPFIVHSGERLVVEDGKVVSDSSRRGEAGEVLAVDVTDNSATIACADGAIYVHFSHGAGPQAGSSFRPGVRLNSASER